MHNPDGWLELETDFEKKKRANAPDKDSTINFQITRSLEKTHLKVTGEEIDEVVKRHKELGIRISNDNLVIDANAVFDLYFSVSERIIPCIEKLVSRREIRDIEYIFLVGGFAESEYLRKAISEEFQKYKVLTPEHSGTAVLRGAVIFGFNTELVTSRVSRKHYGIAINRPFEEGQHDPRKKTVDDKGMAYCQDLFESYIVKGEDLNVGDFKELNFHPFKKGSKNVQLKLYSTDRQDVTYISDKGVELLTEMSVPLEKYSDSLDSDIRFKVYFGGTEIVLESFDNKNKTSVQRASLKCFSQMKPDYAIFPHSYKK